MTYRSSGKLLVGIRAITGYLSIGRGTFERFIELGMPANFIDGRWYANKDNLDDFTRAITKVQPRKMMEEIEMETQK